MESITKEIGERIRSYRRKKRMTQMELAERADCNVSALGKIERGEKTPKILTVYKICKGLDIPMEILFENMIVTDYHDEMKNKFLNLINELPKREQEFLFKISQSIIQYGKMAK